MIVWDEVERKFISIEIVFSGKNLPNVGESEAWRGSGSLATIDKLERHAKGSLIQPEDLRGKAPKGQWAI